MHTRCKTKCRQLPKHAKSTVNTCNKTNRTVTQNNVNQARPKIASVLESSCVSQASGSFSTRLVTSLAYFGSLLSEGCREVLNLSPESILRLHGPTNESILRLHGRNQRTSKVLVKPLFLPVVAQLVSLSGQTILLQKVNTNYNPFMVYRGI